jgi:ABC-type phosphate transport system substrate-binding protein
MSMRGRDLRVAFLLAALTLVLIVAGCGGGSSSSSGSSPEAEPSAQFLRKKGSNTIAEFGKEAAAAEREEANVVVTKSLKARQAADFKTQCETLSIGGIKGIPGAENRKGCPAALKTTATPLSASKEARTDTLDGPIVALRVKGKDGYALYHGNDGQDYAVPLEKENGAWMVGSVNTTEI